MHPKWFLNFIVTLQRARKQLKPIFSIEKRSPFASKLWFCKRLPTRSWATKNGSSFCGKDAWLPVSHLQDLSQWSAVEKLKTIRRCPIELIGFLNIVGHFLSLLENVCWLVPSVEAEWSSTLVRSSEPEQLQSIFIYCWCLMVFYPAAPYRLVPQRWEATLIFNQ